MSVSQFDVIIAGAGPAGSMTAFHLGERFDCSVLMLEKAVFPRRKVCAGALMSRTLSYIPFDVSGVVRATINSFVVTCNLAGEFCATYERPLASLVDRAEFDLLLLEKAMAKCRNITVKQGETAVALEQEPDQVLVYTDKSAYSCKVLVAADGASSRIAKSLGLIQPQDIELAIEGSLPAKQANVQAGRAIVDCCTDYDGYAWVFPRGEVLSVGAGGRSTSVSDLHVYLREFLASNALADDMPSDTKPHAVPLYNSRSAIVKGRVLLVGDAAGLIEPFTREGISGALVSAQIASESIVALLTGKQDTLSSYERRVRSCILASLKCARAIRDSFCADPNFLYRTLRHTPWLLSTAGQFLAGSYSYTELARLLRLKLL